MQKYTKFDNVAVIYSPSFGAGWYTWNYMHYPAPERMIFDSDLVQILLDRDEKLFQENDLEYRKKILDESEEKFLIRLNELFDSFDASVFDIENLEIAWIPKGVEFFIKEYDGSESIQTKDNFKWIKA